MFGYVELALEDVLVSLRTGLNPRKFFKLNTEDADNYYVTIRELQNNRVVFNVNTDRLNDEALNLCNNRSNLEEGDILFSGTGTIGEVALIDKTPENWNIKEGVYSLKPQPNVMDSKYLMYTLRTAPVRAKFLAMAEGGTVKSVSMKNMNKLRICVPSLERQKQLVSILDRFDTLCNDISSGLPAEIEARKKQYEYYRDKLLSFEEIKR